MSTDSVLITGGAGFIGSRLSRSLLDQGHHVVVADVLHPQVHTTDGWPADLPREVEFHPVDATSGTQWAALFKVLRPTTVVHLAAETGTGQSLLQSTRHASVNVVGTCALLDAMSGVGHVPDHVVLASSRAVYGEGMWRGQGGQLFSAAPRDGISLARGRWLPVDADGNPGVTPVAHRAADTTPRPGNVYAATKLAQEHILEAWTASFGTRLSVLRLQNVYGPGQSLTNPYTGIVSFFAQRGLDGQAIDVFEGGGIVRDLVFVDDVVRALHAAIDRTGDGALLADIGSGEPLTLLQLAHTIAELTGSPAPVVTETFRPGDVRAAYADVSDAHDLLGYTPQVDARTGVGLLLDWIRATRGADVDQRIAASAA